jgi:ligand-binding sensor domain-containing protein/cbb3-type cytochrome oxidase subunit 3
MRYGFLILFIGFFHTSLKAQENSQLPAYYFKNLNNNDGLINNHVTAITQDGRGFIWIGTKKGLQRFDGVRFQNYPDNTLPPGEDIGVVDATADDKRHSIWFNCYYHGIRQLNYLTNEIKPIAFKNLPGVLNESFLDEKGRKWLIGERHFLAFEQPGQLYRNHVMYRGPDDSIDQLAPGLRLPERNQVWAFDLNLGILIFDRDTRKVYSKTFNPEDNTLLQFYNQNSNTSFRKMIADSHGNIWVYTWQDKFFRYNLASNQVHKYSIRSIIESKGISNTDYGWINDMIEDSHGIIWVATAHAGLLQYNYQNDEFKWMPHDAQGKNQLQYNFEIYTLFQDKEENIWIGSDKGISVFNPYRSFFTALNSKLPPHEILDAVESKQGEFYVGTWGGGISIYDAELSHKKNISFDTPYQKNLVWCFEENDDGTIWAGCQHGYLHIINTSTHAVNTIRPKETGNSTILCMNKDRYGNIWMGLNNGWIVEWNKKENRFVAFNHSILPDSIQLAQVNNIFIDGAGKFWVFTPIGIREFDPVKMVYTANYRPDHYYPHLIQSSNLFGLEEYNDSTLFVGTVNSGIYYFNKRTKAFARIALNNDNSLYSAYAVKKDHTGNLWFTSDYNLYKYNPATGNFISCGPEKGMVNSSFASSRFYETRSGKWLTWTETEVLIFNPDNINQAEKNEMPLTITGFKVSGKPVTIDSLVYWNKPLSLNYKQNFLTIEFAIPGYSGVQQSLYQYQLSGVDENWVDAGTKAFANYTDLSPGNYIFRVRKVNSTPDKQFASFVFVISPPFWKSWWFLVFVAVLFVATVWWLLKKRIRNIRHEAEMKHKIAEAEMQALRAQMNPHFIFNCLNAIDNLIQTNQKSKATTYLNRFARLIRSVLDSSKNNLVPFHKDFESLRLFLELEQFRCDNKFEYSLKADPEILNSDMKVPSLIIQPFVENAIHHGLMNKSENDRRLSVDISYEKDFIHYIIEDNGIGRKKAAQLKLMNRPEHIPYGIDISKKRADLYNNNGKDHSISIIDLEVDSKPAGTRVELWLYAQ